MLGGHFIQKVEADGLRNPTYDVTQLLDEGVTGHPFVHEVGTDRIPVLGFRDRNNDVTQLLSEGVACHKCVNQVQVFDNSGATWIDPDNDVKGSKVNPRMKFPKLKLY